MSAAIRDNSNDEADADLERRIECARIAMTLAKDEMSLRDHLTRMEILIAQRSSQQIEKMEIERGLRAP
jgi:hypothetical protein